MVELNCFVFKSKGWNQTFKEDKGLEKLKFAINVLVLDLRHAGIE